MTTSIFFFKENEEHRYKEWYLVSTSTESKDFKRGHLIQPYDADPFGYKNLLLPEFYLW